MCPRKTCLTFELDQPARVTATPFGDSEFKGYVKRIAPIVESKTGTVKVTIGFRDIGSCSPACMWTWNSSPPNAPMPC